MLLIFSFRIFCCNSNYRKIYMEKYYENVCVFIPNLKADVEMMIFSGQCYSEHVFDGELY